MSFIAIAYVSVYRVTTDCLTGAIVEYSDSPVISDVIESAGSNMGAASIFSIIVLLCLVFVGLAGMAHAQSVASFSLGLGQGWNLVSFPVANSSLRASSLAGTGVSLVCAFNASTGDYDSYIEGVSPASYDFALSSGTGYFMYCPSNTSLVINGSDQSNPGVVIDPGWNMIGWSSYNSSTAKIVSKALSSGNTQMVIALFNASTGDYDSYIEGVSPDEFNFALTPGTGYFVYSGSTIPETLYYNDMSPSVVDFTSNVTSGDTPLAVQFTDLSSNGPTSWNWSFGDGGTSTLQDPTHTFNRFGVYTVTLTITNDAGISTKQIVNYITVNDPAPVANFTSNVTIGTAPLTVQFNDTSIGHNTTSWQWNFGDGTGNVTDQDPTHTFNGYGNYTVTLTVSNDGGSSTKPAMDYIAVYDAAPVAGFIGTPTSGSEPLTIQFNDTSAGNNITSWLWDFGDGSSSTIQDPAHIFNFGNYTVTLTVSNDGGSSTTQKVDYITVYDPAPNASFTSNISYGDEPLTVQFNDTSTGNNITSWQWDFDDGTSNITTQDPVHTFNDPGNYTITLTVSNDGGSSTEQIAGYVTVYDSQPMANFTSNLTSGSAPLSVQFNDTSLGNNITSWQWNFCDGTGNDTTMNPVHTFVNTNATNITYTVTLTVSNDGGSSTTQFMNYITVVPQEPSAGFTSNITSGSFPLTVQFNDTSSGNISSRQWDFGDGTGNSTIEDPVHTFNSYGNYTVTLTVYNAGGSSTEQIVNYMTVNDPVPTANFTSNVTMGNSPLTVQFTNTSIVNNITSLHWEFGDGGTSSAEDPVYTYAVPGKYNVSLTVTNSAGSNTMIQVNYITVIQPAPVANFSANVTSGVVPLTVQFTDLSSNNPTAWNWSFGDGNTSTSENPVHTYGAVGNYSASFNASNAGGSNTSAYTNITVVSGIISFQLSLGQGWNLASFPVMNSSLNASGLAGTGVSIVSAFNASTGDYDSYIEDVSLSSDDFALSSGTGYFLYCPTNSSLEINGKNQSEPSVTINPGWNMIGWSSYNSSTAKDVCEALSGSSKVISRFNATTGNYDSYISGVSPDSRNFAVSPGTGYFVYSGSTSPQTLDYDSIA